MASTQTPPSRNSVSPRQGNTSPAPTDGQAGILADNVRPWQQRFQQRRRKVMSDFVFMVWLAVITGVLAGTGAYVFKRLIALVAGLFLPHIAADGFNWWLIAVPVAGITLAGIFTRYIVRTNLTHGCSQLIHDLRHGVYRLKHNITFSPIVGGTVTLGMGGSAGAEGPIAYTGAAIGSNIGQLLGLSPRMMKILVGCGAGAGIAGIFMAPIGGLMFTLELLRIEISAVAVLGVTVSCLASYITILTWEGGGVDLAFHGLEGDMSGLWVVALCTGAFCGLYSLYYSMVMHRLDVWYARIANPWVRNVTGGLALGLALFMFPALYSTGYPVLGHVINGDFAALARGSVLNGLHLGDRGLMATAAGILALKCWATGSTNSSGGVAGDFAPTLFAGGMAGFLFASLANTLFGFTLPVGSCAYLGMAAVMAGAIQAPLMAIFITMEMSQSYGYALPLALSAVVSYAMVRLGAAHFGLHHRLVMHHGWWDKIIANKAKA